MTTLAASVAEASELPNGATFLPDPPAVAAPLPLTPLPQWHPDAAAAAASAAVAATAAAAVRPQELTTRSIDTSVLAPLFDATRCVALQVEQNVSDLYSALAAYTADAAGASTSLALPARLWRESERMDEDEQGAAGADMFTVRTHAGVGAHAVAWRGRRVWVVVAVARTPSMRGDFPRSLFLYSELEGAPLTPLEGGGGAGAGRGAATRRGRVCGRHHGQRRVFGLGQRAVHSDGGGSGGCGGRGGGGRGSCERAGRGGRHSGGSGSGGDPPCGGAGAPDDLCQARPRLGARPLRVAPADAL